MNIYERCEGIKMEALQWRRKDLGPGTGLSHVPIYPARFDTPPPIGDKILPLFNLNSEEFGVFVLAVPPLLLFRETTSLDAAPALFLSRSQIEAVRWCQRRSHFSGSLLGLWVSGSASHLDALTSS